MIKQIVSRHMELDQELKTKVAHLINRIPRYDLNITSIRVIIEDVNGPNKGGIDMRCHLSVRGAHKLDIEIEEIDENCWQAVSLAFQRLNLVLSKIHLQRRFMRTNTASLTGQRTNRWPKH